MLAKPDIDATAIYAGARNIRRTPKIRSTSDAGVPDYTTLRMMQHNGSLCTFGMEGGF